MSAVTAPATLRDALQVVDLGADDLPEAVEVLARGMRDNPVHVAAYGPDPGRRLELIRTAFRAVFATSAHQQPFGLRWDGVLVAVTGAAPPGTCRPGLAQRVRMAPTMARLGPRTASRVGRWLGEWARHDPDAPHAHLGPLAVDSDLQGRGIGTVLLAEHCRRVDLAGHASYLETDKPENVRFYRRAGFEVVREGDVLGVPNWYMRREPVVSPPRPGVS